MLSCLSQLVQALMVHADSPMSPNLNTGNLKSLSAERVKQEGPGCVVFLIYYGHTSIIHSNHITLCRPNEKLLLYCSETLLGTVKMQIIMSGACALY